jgi:LPXTG-motif cell wall-anchored protein
MTTKMPRARWRLPRLVVSVAVLAASSLIGLAGSPSPASASAGCGTMTGSGTEADPWRLWTDADLDCVAVGSTWVPGDGGAHGWVEIMDDLVYDSAIPILAALGFTYLHLDGRGHSVSIDGVIEGNGLLANTIDADVRNLVVAAVNGSTLVLGAGWFVHYDTGSTFTNVGSTGDISVEGGGIVGSANGTTIDGAFSTGAIGRLGGGILGDQSRFSHVTRAVSTGSIGTLAGGIIGDRSNEVSVSQSFSNGLIGSEGGGIVGAFSEGSTVVSSYSTGLVESSAGGLIGRDSTSAVISNSYTLGFVNSGGGPFFGSNDSDSTIVNSLAFENNAWSDVDAMSMLTGAGTTWMSCAINEPWAIASFYPDDICSPARDEVVVAEMAPMSVRRVAPPDGVFSLVNGVGTHPFSWVSIVNDTASVRMNGVDCTTPTSCIVQGFVQSGAVAARDVTIVSAGRVTVLVHDAGEIGHREVFDLDVGDAGLPETGVSASPFLAGAIALLSVAVLLMWSRRRLSVRVIA